MRTKLAATVLAGLLVLGGAACSEEGGGAGTDTDPLAPAATDPAVGDPAVDDPLADPTE